MSTQTTVAGRPIVFSSPMVQAILAGRKSQTRRIVFKDDPEHHMPWWCAGTHWQDGDKKLRCPYAVGMRLWVREAWAIVHCSEEELDDWPKHRAVPSCPPGMGWQVWYRSGNPYENDCFEDRGFRWRPSVHMPRWASRVTLEITEVRVERLGSLTPEDALAEGIADYAAQHNLTGYYTTAFARLWDEINEKRPGCSWADSPWCWVIAFKRLEPTP